jgi:hypothetical protein
MPAKKKADADPGVAVNPPHTEDRYAERGVPVSVPADASDSESKSGQKANTTKEKD